MPVALLLSQWTRLLLWLLLHLLPFQKSRPSPHCQSQTTEAATFFFVTCTRVLVLVLVLELFLL